MADSQELVRRACKAIERQMQNKYNGAEILMPNAVLPISKTWYGFSAQTGPTSALEYRDGWWDDGLQKCAQILKKKGAVVVEFWSPDNPDDYHEFANTTAQGGTEMGRGYALHSYKKALGCDDVRLVCEELLLGRTQYERDAEVKRKLMQAKRLKEKADFEIVNGVLKKYRGTDEEVTLPDSVTEIGELAFVDEPRWRRMLLNDEIYDAPALETLVIPKGVKKIGTYALSYCENLTEISIPDTAAVIEERAFEGCEALESITLPKAMKAIEDFTFFDCDSLESVSIPEGLEEIGTGAFWGCCSLDQVTIPDSVVRILRRAFSGCKDLTHVVIPDSLEILEASVFRGCEKLSKITLPRGLKRIGEQALSWCTNLKEIVIPESVVEIGKSAFMSCGKLERVVLHEGLKRIGMNAFKDCRALLEINIPDSLTEIGEDAFDGCEKLGKMTFPPEVRRIGDDVFIDDVCGEQLEFAKILKEIWQRKKGKDRFFDEEFKQAICALDIHSEVAFQDRSFILWSFSDSRRKVLNRDITARGGLTYSPKDEITPDYLVICMEYGGGWLLDEILKKRRRGMSVPARERLMAYIHLFFLPPPGKAVHHSEYWPCRGIIMFCLG